MLWKHNEILGGFHGRSNYDDGTSVKTVYMARIRGSDIIWETSKDLLTPRDFHRSLLVKSRIYHIGGESKK